MSGLADNKDIEILRQCEKINSKNPMKNAADLVILYTAIEEKMDYLVTGNTDDFRKCLELFKATKDIKLELRCNIELEKLL